MDLGPFLISRNRSDVREQASVATWDTTIIKLNYSELQLNKMSDLFVDSGSSA